MHTILDYTTKNIIINSNTEQQQFTQIRRMLQPRQSQIHSQIPESANLDDPIFSGYNSHGMQKNIMNGNQYSGPRNRRELKLEKEELTALFSELISVINDKVSCLDEDHERIPKIVPQPKAKPKFLKGKKEEALGPTNILYKSANFPTKIKQEEPSVQTKRYKLASKEQIFRNYSKIMEYKIDEESMNQSFRVESESQKLPSRNKQFSVVQQISLIVNSANQSR